MKAKINKIIPFSNVDGPGNRMAIFFQGCNFNCKYCHNPETINHCQNCQICIMHCPYNALTYENNHVIWHKEKCRQCDTCIHTCPYSSSPKIKEMSVEELVHEVKKVSSYIRGISVSGGECMLNTDFLLPFFKEIKKLNLSIFVDSNGSVLFENYPELMQYIDKVMLDVKAYDNHFHHYLCHSNNTIVLKNLDYLLKENKLYEVRTVLLPDFEKENQDTITHISKIIQDHCIYKLICYRPYGVRKEESELIGTHSYNLDKAHELAQLAINLGAKKTTVV